MNGGVALVLSGGGAHAAYFGTGVIAGLADEGVRPTLLSGTSAGGLNAGLLAGGLSPDELITLWAGLSARDLYRPRKDVWRLPRLSGLFRLPINDLLGYTLDSCGWTWLLDLTPARRTLVSALGGECLSITPGITVVVSAVEESTSQVARFTNSAPPGSDEFTTTTLTVDHLLAGAAAPVLFAPVPIDGKSYVDAGMVANTPLAPALAYQPDTVIVVTSSSAKPCARPKSLGDALGLVFEDVARFAVLREVDQIESTGTGPRVVLVEPTEEFPVSGFVRFDPDTALGVIAHGRDRAREVLAAKISGSRP